MRFPAMADPLAAGRNAHGERMQGMEGTTRDKRLHIFLRHVHVKHNERSRDPGKQRPAWFSHEACFLNLLDTLGQSPYGHKVTLTVVYDGTAADFEDDFMSRHLAVPRKFPLSIKLVEAGSNVQSWHITLALAMASEMGPDDLVYFMENDYLHVPGWLDRVAEFDAAGIAYDYLSLYDHMDKYILPMYAGLQSSIVVTPRLHWRSAPSTCGTFIQTRQCFLADFDDWMAEVADYYMFARLVGEKGRKLYTPMPGLATHCMEGYLSPVVDWAAIAQAAV
jgi:hypothetical protein